MGPQAPVSPPTGRASPIVIWAAPGIGEPGIAARSQESGSDVRLQSADLGLARRSDDADAPSGLASGPLSAGSAFMPLHLVRF